MVWLSLCDLGTFPWLLLWWLLPFLLGLLLGWLLWGKYKGLLEECQNTLKRCQDDYKILQEKYDNCQADKDELRSDNNMLRVHIDSLESDIAKLKKSNEGQNVVQRKEEDRSNAQLGLIETASSTKSTKSEDSFSLYSAIPNDNLQIVEGIGPVMNRLLNDNGIHTWADLAKQDKDTLKAMLDKHGGKYRIIDPSTWSMQAAMARDGEWEKLVDFQKSLSGSVVSDRSATDSKVEKILIKMGVLKKYKQDDLKAVEGIGPKIEGLFNNAGIKTWKALSETNVDKLKQILADAGARYSLADPTTWPKQAALAAAGKWKELQELQDYLKGGKEPG